MHLRRQKQLLSMLVLGLVCAVVVAVAWPFLVPVDLAAGKTSAATTKKQQVVKPVVMPTQAEFAEVWDKPLQRPLVDPAVEQSAPEIAGVPKPDWKLVSVFWKETAPASSLATIQIGPEPTDRKYVSVGDTVLNGKVIKMAESAVTISVDGQEFEFGLNGEGGESE